MGNFLAGLAVGILAGCLLGLVIPLQFFLIVCLLLLGLGVFFFILFHLGVRDFQD